MGVDGKGTIGDVGNGSLLLLTVFEPPPTVDPLFVVGLLLLLLLLIIYVFTTVNTTVTLPFSSFNVISSCLLSLAVHVWASAKALRYKKSLSLMQYFRVPAKFPTSKEPLE